MVNPTRIGAIVLLATVLPAGASETQPPTTQPSAGEALARTLTLMEQSRQQLSVKLDPGPETQAVQQQIVAALDDLIAAAMAGAKGTAGASGQPQPGERRERQQPGQPDKTADGPPTPAGDVPGQPGSVQSDGTGLTTPSGEFRESRRGWGHLPPRERDEIIQGVREAVLEKYREQINQYYRALAEEETE
jgi:hypothetical protein